MLTRRGRAVTVVALALAGSAGLFGIEELYPLSAAAGALLISAALWTRLRPWKVSTVRQIRPRRVSAASNAQVDLAITNRASRHKSPVLVARDPFGDARAAEFVVAPLDPGETTRAAYRLPTGRRGRYQVGPLRLELSDPFGLTTVSRAGAGAAVLTVHPPIVALPAAPSRSGHDRRDGGQAAVLGRGDEFYGIREYQDGDDLRRVHWPSTARAGEVMIRQDETSWWGQLTVVVDLRNYLHDEDSLETALSAAASVCATSGKGRLRVRLLTTSGADTGIGAASMQVSVILDQLAVAATHPATSRSGLAPVIERAGTAGSLVIVTTDLADRQELAGVARLAPARSMTVVAVRRVGLPVEGLKPVAPTGARLVSIATLAELPRAWAAADRLDPSGWIATDAEKIANAARESALATGQADAPSTPGPSEAQWA